MTDPDPTSRQPSLVIAPRFCGPPGIGNGGYVSGLVAAHLDGPAEVTLRRPAPLGKPLSVERDDSGVRVLDGDTLIAEGRRVPDRLPTEVPGPVSIEAARDAGARSRLRLRPDEHPFPDCFVCGWRRPPGDGLGIMVGPVPGRGLLADAWSPDPEFAGDDGQLRPEFLWAALDCPGGFGAFAHAAPESGVPVGGVPDGTVPDVTSPDGAGTAADAADSPLYLLGRLTMRQLGPVQAGEPHAVTGWRLEKDHLKMLAGSALFTASGQPVGIAHAVWIRLR